MIVAVGGQVQRPGTDFTFGSTINVSSFITGATTANELYWNTYVDGVPMSYNHEGISVGSGYKTNLTTFEVDVPVGLHRVNAAGYMSAAGTFNLRDDRTTLVKASS